MFLLLPVIGSSLLLLGFVDELLLAVLVVSASLLGFDLGLGALVEGDAVLVDKAVGVLLLGLGLLAARGEFSGGFGLGF